MATKSVRLPKTDSRYWTSKVFRRGAGYSIRFEHHGKAVWLATGQSIKEEAAKAAAAFFKRVEEKGLEAALEERRPKKSDGTVGALISGLLANMGKAGSAAPTPTGGKVSKRRTPPRPETFANYVSCFRRIAADIAGIADDPKLKYSCKGTWKEATDGIRLEILTPASVAVWCENAKGVMAGESVATFIRGASALWRQARLWKTGVTIPNWDPFSEVILPESADTLFKSDVDAVKLFAKGWKELPRDEKAVFILALACGLRRREIDCLRWEHITKDGVKVTPTPEYQLKSKTSERVVAFEPSIWEVFSEWKAGELPSAYVIRCDKPARRNGYVTIRADAVFKNVISWLRANGMKTEQKPLHTLRKLAGSLVAKRAGPYAAQVLLGHSSIKTTEEHYLDRKTNVTTGLGEIIPFKKGKGKMASA